MDKEIILFGVGLFILIFTPVKGLGIILIVIGIILFYMNKNKSKKESINTPSKNKNMSELNQIKKLERTYDKNLSSGGEQYYNSEEAHRLGKKIYNDKKEYIKNNPKDFQTRGAQLYGYSLSAINDQSNIDKEIFSLVGEGQYYEKEVKNYEKALEYYSKANVLFFNAHGKELKEIEKDVGHKLAPQLTERRIEICKDKIFREKCKKLEKEAKDLEEVNPEKAIEIYKELNILRPGLKKFNKRITVCQNKLKNNQK